MLAAAALALGVYVLQYHGKVGPRAAEQDFLDHTSARTIHCVHGWRRLSGWDYVCRVTWPDDPPQTIHLNVDGHGVTEHEV